MVDYSISHKVLNTADFGVPQVRERTFIVGIRNGKKFQFPYPSFIDSSEASVDFFDSLIEMLGMQLVICHKMDRKMKT